MQPQPHDAWAEIYDCVYEEQFRDVYSTLTENTISYIQSLMPAGSAIVDFGAGTGRLAIPLAQAGYAVTAVERSLPMLNRLRAKDQNQSIQCVHSDIGSYQSDTQFDLALCIFTIVSYLLDENALQLALQSAYTALKPGGAMLLDVPNRALFQNTEFTNEHIRRIVQVEKIEPFQKNLYAYNDHIEIFNDNQWQHYDDSFHIRYWSTKEIAGQAKHCGFAHDPQENQNASYATYMKFSKPSTDR
ncbi:class I SAM-dependent methyltransferase [Candidatus Symbiobacter mobilis]|uniref:SAM-dependent methyltransferase n=1 Tax=Candidatus Symbiobacter mobilis CR TaxID=946483 RepID=U5NDW0_9BURK|nr:class I SAM-dependent methyltransferase [Candidatus Symbiobacter mobilis]AGX88324.1 SAM-dependent methyltransferase [Candidatus Symbiobacter mobilis CR]